MCLDKVSKDDCTYARLWGQPHMGTHVEQHAPFVRKRRFSMVAALALDEGIVAANVIEGSFNRERFMEYLHDDIVNFLFFFLLPYPHRAYSFLCQLHTLVHEVSLLWITLKFIIQMRLINLSRAMVCAD